MLWLVMKGKLEREGQPSLERGKDGQLERGRESAWS